MKFDKYYIVANTRNQFENASKVSFRPYNDHPSLESIEYMVAELSKSGFNTMHFGGVDELIDAYHQKLEFPKTLFLSLSDGLTQPSRKAQASILLELIGASYAGSDPLAHLMAGNKTYAKKIVKEKLCVPKSFLLFNQSNISDFPLNIDFPVVIKPNREGSSIGITQQNICTNIAELRQQLYLLLEQFDDVIVEEYISGYEITCFIIGNRGNYYLTEPILCEYDGVRFFENFVFGLEEKASRARKEYLAQSVLDFQTVDYIRRAAQVAFELLNMRDFARVDFRLGKDGTLYFIELNSNPVISETSELGVISQARNIPFGNLAGKIIHTAVKRLNATRG
mgnify:CR=1 FL=1